MKKFPVANKDLSNRLAHRKHIHELKRLRVWRNKFHPSIQSNELDSVPITSRIIDLLAQNYAPLAHTKKQELAIKIPSTFSILDAPKETIEYLCRFAAACKKEKPIKRINIDHSRLNTFDLSANAILDTIVTELEELKKRRGRRKKLHSKGIFPSHPHIKRFIRAIGIIKHLEVKSHAPKPAEADALEVFDVRLSIRSPDHVSSNSSKRDRTITEFVEHTNKCLAKMNKQLTALGVSNLCNYLGEILGNAEEHAGMIDWTLQGYLDNHLDTPIYEISIFNFGKSIAETLAELDDNHYTRKQIDKYIQTHTSKQLFCKTWEMNDLLTVAAFQRNVSSKNDSASTTRGQGTMELLKFFQSIYSSNIVSKGNANIGIVSGSTYINFDSTYATQLGKNPDKIAFNAKNDLNYRPDEKYVCNLGDVKFPGTIIALRFPLTTSQLVDDQRNE